MVLSRICYYPVIYEEAVTELFDALDHWEGVLAENATCAEIITKQTGVCSQRFFASIQYTTSTLNATCAALLITPISGTTSRNSPVALGLRKHAT